MRMAETIETAGRRRAAVVLACGIGLAVLLAPGAQSRAEPGPRLPAAVPGEVIVRFDPGAAPARRADALSSAARAVESLRVRGIKLLTLRSGVSVGDAIAALENNPAVAYAEPNYIRTLRSVTDDPFLAHQWGLRQIGAPAAWRRTKGSRRVAIAVADDGIQIAHPDLGSNIWVNRGEAPGELRSNGVDDDRNGDVDDWRGWDLVDLDNDPSPEAEPSEGGEIAPHGTHVAGIIGAVGNNGLGTAGVNWKIAIMPLRIFGASGFTTTARIVHAIEYAGAHRARAFNASFGSETPSQAEYDAIASYPRMLVVVAAPNTPADLDKHPDYPCSYKLKNVICVTATSRSGALAGFASRGRRTADIAAPGVEIVSTIPGNYGALSGTSQSAPHVAGAIGLIASAHPKLGAKQIKSVLLSSAVRGKLKNRVASGRLNVHRALARAAKVAAQAKKKDKRKKKARRS